LPVTVDAVSKVDASRSRILKNDERINTSMTASRFGVNSIREETFNGENDSDAAPRVPLTILGYSPLFKGILWLSHQPKTYLPTPVELRSRVAPAIWKISRNALIAINFRIVGNSEVTRCCDSEDDNAQLSLLK